jgi:hypothetical protein
MTTTSPKVLHRKSVRLQTYDYAMAGAYFITIVTKDRKCFFGEVVDVEIKLNHWGQIVQDEWKNSTQIRMGGRPAGRPYNRDHHGGH